ncbi:ketopantoate reductase family protein [Streptomyces meridianus]|uniref:2-dehydropantoate 2-reductase n=1 Tax=Streptomyces meridianus TaxID=2938945 RepID=A0ABT0X6N1_9ACTN|nr:2-dehydropantoate 2-reductase [Streptomyces meridianus]MCM2578186.1 2-dehydropantoate 2-reductase [Streptomyces meridianus]
MSGRILVVGAGAIGGVTAAHLTRAGHEVVVLDADPEHVALLNEPGLLFDEFGSCSRVLIRAVESAERLTGRFDYALVTLKSLHLKAALTPLVEGDLVETYVSLGNGLVQDAVEEIVGPGRLVTGIVEWGATNLGPGHLRQTTRAPFVVGEADGSSSRRVSRLAEILADAAPGTRASPQISGQVWSKLLLNSTFSGLGAVGGGLYADVAADPVGREAAFRLWTEGYDVATALGVRLDEIFGIHPSQLVVRSAGDVPAATAALATVMSGAAATKASMLQDLERGALTEVDVINGGVVATARRLGRSAPLNAEIVTLVHAYEQGVGAPGPGAFARLAALGAGRPVSPIPKEHTHG